MQYCVLYHYTNIVVLTFDVIDLFWYSDFINPYIYKLPDIIVSIIIS